MKPEKKSKSDPAQGMRDAMKKATTEMLVLFMLRQKPMYTYQMAQEVDRLTQGVLTYNTMYLAVYRLQEGGYIQETEKRIEDGRARIYMDITSAGQEYYEKLIQNFYHGIREIDDAGRCLVPGGNKRCLKKNCKPI